MAITNCIDATRCGQCGTCITVCPAHIPYRAVEGRAVALHGDRLWACLRCGHCMAACPSQAMHVVGLSYEVDLVPVPAGGMGGESLVGLLGGRRSIRVFQDKPVPREVLEQIVEAISLAPMGFPPHKVEVTVVQTREKIEQALPVIVATFERLARWMRNPFMRWVIRHKATPDAFNLLKNHVLPMMEYRLPAMKAGEGDTITRGAPALILFHADRGAEGHVADAWIALTYGLLAAHALGLGATAISLVPTVVDKVAELRALFQIPAENEVVASMVVGYPRVRFHKGIRRELAGVNWI